MSSALPAAAGEASEVEVISQQVDEEARSVAPGRLAPFAYRDLPLAAVDLSATGSQLLSPLDEDYQREGPAWLRPCCGERAAVWQALLLSAGLNSVLVACVMLVVTLLTLELLIDIKLLQFASAFQLAAVIHWISLVILSAFFSETVLRIVVLGVWDYIENKVEVFDGAVTVLSLAPMVASTVANGPRSPWDSISLLIVLRIWRVKRVIDAYVLPVKAEMEMVVQQYEKAKVIQDEQLERLTQICQEQGFEIRQLRAHLAQQELDLAAEREVALRAPQGLCLPGGRYHVAEETAMKGFEGELPRSPDSGIPEPATCLVTMAAVDIHQPDVSSDLFSVDVPLKPGGQGSCLSSAPDSASCSTGSWAPRNQGGGGTLCSSWDGSTTHDVSSEPSSSPLPPAPPQQRVAETTAQDLLSSLSEDPCPSQGASDPAPSAPPSPAGSAQTSPELDPRVSLFNQKNQEGFPALQIQRVIHFQPAAPTLHKLTPLDSKEQTLHRVPEA